MMKYYACVTVISCYSTVWVQRHRSAVGSRIFTLERKCQQMNNSTAGRDSCVSGRSECVNEFTYTNRRVWFVGLSHFQHSAAHFLLMFKGNVVFPCIQSLAKAAIFVYTVKTKNSTRESWIKLIFTEMLYCIKYCNRTSTLISTNNWILSVASEQLSNDILIHARRWYPVDSGVPTEIS